MNKWTNGTVQKQLYPNQRGYVMLLLAVVSAIENLWNHTWNLGDYTENLGDYTENINYENLGDYTENINYENLGDYTENSTRDGQINL